MNAQTHKHVPERTCVVCRQKADKRQLSRFVRTDDGVFLDPTGKQAGRGAYLCDSASCRQRALTTDILSKALKVALSEEDRQRIKEVALS